MTAASQRRRSVGSAGAGGTPSASGSSPAPGSSARGYRRRPSIGTPGSGSVGVGGSDVTPGGRAPAPAVAERPGLRIMRIVGSQYDATVGVEAWVAKAEAKVKVRGEKSVSCEHTGRLVKWGSVFGGDFSYIYSVCISSRMAGLQGVGYTWRSSSSMLA